jgi:hypothetical protein
MPDLILKLLVVVEMVNNHMRDVQLDFEQWIPLRERLERSARHLSLLNERGSFSRMVGA